MGGKPAFPTTQVRELLRADTNRRPRMWHDDPRAREAFRQGARAAFESSVIHMGARERWALTQWLEELEEWDEGEPPASPVEW